MKETERRSMGETYFQGARVTIELASVLHTSCLGLLNVYL